MLSCSLFSIISGGLLGSINDPDIQQVFSNPKVGCWSFSAKQLCVASGGIFRITCALLRAALFGHR